MSTKDEVLALLMDSEEPLSGEEMARRLGVSRNAVWKAVQALREEGHEFEAVTHRGYRLVRLSGRISITQIRKWLRPGQFPAEVELHNSIDSTNKRAKALACEGASHGTLVLADSQSQGKGRMGRSFFSPPHSGIYMSMILRPHMPAEQGVLITSMAAVAVAEAIEQIAACHVGIKWVNDLYIQGRKVCGILCEAGVDLESGGLDHVILGIGINVAAMRFPEELADIATSIENETHTSVSRNRLIAEIIDRLNILYDQLQSRSFMAEYRDRSIVIGRDVWVLRGGESFRAHALDIDDSGHLIAQSEGGIQILESGEVSLRWFANQ